MEIFLSLNDQLDEDNDKNAKVLKEKIMQLDDSDQELEHEGIELTMGGKSNFKGYTQGGE